jgi:hypothetical protein
VPRSTITPCHVGGFTAATSARGRTRKVAVSLRSIFDLERLYEKEMSALLDSSNPEEFSSISRRKHKQSK